MNETVSVNGRNVSYRQIQGSGAGRTILMVHGAGDHSWIWNSQMDFLGDHHRRIAVDLPGRIGSDGPPIDKAPEFRTSVREFAQSLQLESFVLFGHSMGGSIALDFALHHAEMLDGFVMVGSSPSWGMGTQEESLLRDDPEAAVEKINAEFGDIFSRHTAQSIRDENLRQGKAVPPATAAADILACMTYHLEGDLERIDVPVLVICGDEDAGSLPGSRLCGDKLPRADFELVNRCGHVIMIEQPDVLNAALARFVDSLG